MKETMKLYITEKSSQTTFLKDTVSSFKNPSDFDFKIEHLSGSLGVSFKKIISVSVKEKLNNLKNNDYGLSII